MSLDLGAAYRQLERMSSLSFHYRQALQGRTEQLGEDPSTLNTASNLGVPFKNVEQYEEAEELPEGCCLIESVYLALPTPALKVMAPSCFIALAASV